MKKLMIAACAIAMAAVAQAATYQWSDGKSCLYTWNACDPDWNSVTAGTTAYFVFADAYSQSQLVDAFQAGTLNASSVAASTSTVKSSGAINASSTFTADYTADTQGYYFVLFDKHLFVSDLTTATYNKLSTSSVTFADQTDYADPSVTDVMDAKLGFDTAGWYEASTEPTPEPTSAMLMLLGMAGLALRRKQK